MAIFEFDFWDLFMAFWLFSNFGPFLSIFEAFYHGACKMTYTTLFRLFLWIFGVNSVKLAQKWFNKTAKWLQKSESFSAKEIISGSNLFSVSLIPKQGSNVLHQGSDFVKRGAFFLKIKSKFFLFYLKIWVIFFKLISKDFPGN